MSALGKFFKKVSINNIVKAAKKVTLRGTVNAVNNTLTVLPSVTSYLGPAGAVFSTVASFSPGKTTQVNGKQVPVTAVNNIPPVAPIDQKAGNLQDATATSDWLRGGAAKASSSGDWFTDFINSFGV